MKEKDQGKVSKCECHARLRRAQSGAKCPFKLFNTQIVGGGGGKARRRGASDDHDDHVTTVTHAENELKDEIQTCGRNVRDIEQSIAQFDNGNGKITRSELKKSLESVNVHLSRQSLILLFQHFDRRGDGKICYKDFVWFALQRPSKSGEVVRKLRRAIWKIDPVTAFKKGLLKQLARTLKMAKALSYFYR